MTQDPKDQTSTGVGVQGRIQCVWTSGGVCLRQVLCEGCLQEKVAEGDKTVSSGVALSHRCVELVYGAFTLSTEDSSVLS